MSILSRVFYFFGHHGLLAFLLLMVIGILIFIKRQNVLYIVLAFLLGMANVFTGQFANSLFLNAFGVRSTAVITDAEETSSQLNDQNIWEYQYIVKGLDGEYTKGSFSTTSASLYPIKNEIQIPAPGKPFPVKFIRGYERNIVVLSDESVEGIQSKENELLRPVQKAKVQYEADPNYQPFVEEYRQALIKYLKISQQPNLDHYRKELQKLDHSKAISSTL